jgi:hypothetical protein
MQVQHQQDLLLTLANSQREVITRVFTETVFPVTVERYRIVIV